MWFLYSGARISSPTPKGDVTMSLKVAIDSLIHDQVDGYTKLRAKLELIERYKNDEISTTRLAELLDTSLFDLGNKIKEIKEEGAHSEV